MTPSGPEAEAYIHVENWRYAVAELMHYCGSDPAVAVCDKRMYEHLNEKIVEALALARQQGQQEERERCTTLIERNCFHAKGGCFHQFLVEDLRR